MFEPFFVLLEKVLTRLIGEKRTHFVFIVLYFIKREITVRYNDSFLGYFWTILKPLFLMLILTFVFSHIFRSIENYQIFVLTGLMFWNFATEAINRGVYSIIHGGNILKKINVPAWVFPSVCVGSSAISLGLCAIPYLLIYFYYGYSLSSSMLFLPVLFLIYLFFVYSIVLICSSLFVLFRDIAHVLEPILSLIFYGTPIIYSIQNVPEKYLIYMKLNPFCSFLESFREIMLYGRVPSLHSFLILGGVTLVFFSAALLIYKSIKTKITYNI
jgi:ABC-2 type transport system permease protein